MSRRRWVSIAVGLALVVAAGAVFLQEQPGVQARSVTAGSVAVPAPDVDEPVPNGDTSETAILAGGCFWGVQGVFEHVKGVTEALPGYTGGDRQTANYEDVSSCDTGHAESVRITYNPTQVTYGQLLRIYFSVVTDPTQLNRQGPDEGTQYRSAIFAQDDTQKRVAQSYIDQLGRAAVFSGPIVTTVSPKAAFFPAERHHQDFLNSNPTYPYIAINDMPKVDELKELFPDLYRDQPVLVLADSR